MTWGEQAPTHQRTLAECEDVIERGRQTFVEVGLALLEIRDSRLYREGWGTFEDYCQERWGWTREHSYRLIQGAEVAQNVISRSQSLPSQTQAITLAPLPVDEQQAIAQEVDFAQTTVRELREIVRERREAKPHADSWAERMALLTAETAAAPWAEADLPYNRIVQADAQAFLARLPDACANVCVTSPPYWAKRTYGGGEDEIGLEETPADYLAALRVILRDVGRVLRPDGWLFLNVGDTFANQPGQYRGDPERAKGISDKARGAAASAPERRWDVPDKSLCLIPWRLLNDLVLLDGWRCRNVIAWHKRGHQPENVGDRLTQAWEPVLALTRSMYPFFSRDARRDRVMDDWRPVDLWSIAVGRQGEGGEHPAVFPDELVERVIRHACPDDPKATVLDPFAGSGTVLQVANRLGRRFLGCDLKDWSAAGG